MGLMSSLYPTLLYEKIKWCVADSPDIYSYDKKCSVRLRTVIYRIQHEFGVEEKYRISESDREFIDEIIRAYQDELIQKYFNGWASNYKLSNEDYFVVTFNAFLEKHECEQTLRGKNMYTTKSYKSRGCWGTPLFDATYELTDYAVTYHKLYYITQLKCIQLHGKPISEGSIANIVLETCKKAIDTREIEVSQR